MRWTKMEGEAEADQVEGTLWTISGKACCVGEFPRLVSEPPVLIAWYRAGRGRCRPVGGGWGIGEGSGMPCRKGKVSRGEIKSSIFSDVSRNKVNNCTDRYRFVIVWSTGRTDVCELQLRNSTASARFFTGNRFERTS